MKLTDMRDVMHGLSNIGARLDAQDQAIVGTMKAYFDEIFQIERDDADFHKSGKADDAEAILEYMQESVDRKLVVHDKYWCNDSSFYKPNGMSSHPDHDWSLIQSFKILRTGDVSDPLFLFLYSYPSAGAPDVSFLHCYQIRSISGEPRIEHSLS